tara:strand:+ start:667 stop:1308 length:642 start_codon:yes stop_codon:yes gene_type:complete
MRHLYDKFVNRRSVNLDISNKCTLECIACSRQTNRFNNQPIPGNDMTISQWKKLAKHYKRFSLCGQISDPIFNPNLLEFIKIAKDNNILMSIHTAATAKNKKLDWYMKAFKLYKEGVSWKFGIDGFPDVSPLYRTNQDAEFLFDVMLKGKEINADVKWQFIIFSFNEHQIEDAKKFAKEKRIGLQFKRSSRFVGERLRPKKRENWISKLNNAY